MTCQISSVTASLPTRVEDPADALLPSSGKDATRPDGRTSLAGSGLISLDTIRTVRTTPHSAHVEEGLLRESFIMSTGASAPQAGAAATMMQARRLRMGFPFGRLQRPASPTGAAAAMAQRCLSAAAVRLFRLRRHRTDQGFQLRAHGQVDARPAGQALEEPALVLALHLAVVGELAQGFR